MFKVLSVSAIFLTLTALPFASRQQEQQPAPVAAMPLPPIPPEAAAMVNPVKPTAESQALAKRTYGYDCAICHGEAGNGKGDLGPKYDVKDWTNAATLSPMTDGQLFYIIKNGRGHMPAEGDRAKDNEIWNLVLLVRSYSKK